MIAIHSDTLLTVESLDIVYCLQYKVHGAHADNEEPPVTESNRLLPTYNEYIRASAERLDSVDSS